MTIWDSHPELKEDLVALEECLHAEFSGNNPYLDRISRTMFKSGGKRLRPALLLASSRAGGQQDRETALICAAAIETLHSATLIHDDIIDNTELRRGKPTVSALHGTKIAVYAGDYLFVKSLMMLSRSGLTSEKLNEVARALEAVFEGETNQFFGRGKIPGLKEYLKRISGKTATLYSAACTLGALAGGFNQKETKLFGRFGMYLGIAFQIKDDILDITSTTALLGKPASNDLKEGIITLPVLLAIRKAGEGKTAADEEFIKLFNSGSIDIIAENQEAIASYVIGSGCIEKAHKILKRYHQKCNDVLQRIRKRQFDGKVLMDIAEFICN